MKKKAAESRDKRVIFIANLALDYNRQIVQGASDWAQSHPALCLYFSDNDTPSDFRQIINANLAGGFDGVLIGACSQSLALPLRIKQLNIPAVDTSGELYPPPLPRIITDDRAAGRIAAEYFLTRGFRRFAYFGFEHFYWSRQRYEGFAAALAAHRLHASVHYLSEDDNIARIADAEREIKALIRKTDPITALFCANDGLASCMIEACMHAGLRIPEQVAILGADDDHLYTRMREPHISSITIQGRQIGWRAMEILGDMILNNGRPPEQQVLIPPGSIITRRSTDIIAVEDELIHQAITYIQSHLKDGINVKQLARTLSVSRTTLENRFVHILSRSPAAEIRRQRIDLVKHLLSSTTLSIKEIAGRSGFSSSQLFSESFRRSTHLTPKAFRESVRRSP